MTAASGGATDVEWLHDRSEDGTVSYRMGRQGSVVVAEWPGIARLTCAPDGSSSQLNPLPAAPAGAVEKLRGLTRVLIGELAGGLGVHGAAVALDSRALLLLGKSGAGKSTTAAALCTTHEGLLLADDATLLEERHGVVEVVPSESKHYLNRASRDAVGVPEESGGSDDWKVAVQATACAARGYPVGLVVCLELGQTVSAGSPRRLTGAEAVARMLGSMFRFNPLDEGARRRELDRVLHLYSQAPFIEIRRPHSGYDPVPQILHALDGAASAH